MEMNRKGSYWKNKKVLITGHEGFLGSWLARTLLERGARVIGLDKVKDRPVSILNGIRQRMTCVKGNVSNLKLVEDIINSYRPEVIFHTAAEAIVVIANKRPLVTFRTNIEGTWNILESSRGKHFIEAIVVSSSDKAYGICKELPYKEDTPLRGAHPYDVSKSCADLLCYTYYNTFKVPVCVTRCGNIYGPGDFNYSRITPDAIRCALQNKQFVIRSDGKFTRDYVYVEDIVNGYVTLAEKMKKLMLYGEAFNFSNENPIMVIELVKKIYQIIGKKPNYKILNEARYEIEHQYLSSKKARKILRWKPSYGLDEGLDLTVDWYRNILGKEG